MTSETFSSINSIIERDKTDTPYKYSLLRSVIESCQEYPQYAKAGQGEYEGKVILPMGLLVFKWLIYYYPFFEGEFIALKKGEKPGHQNLAFRDQFQALTAYYTSRGGFSVFYDDLLSGSMPQEVTPILASLVNKIRYTIVDKPMRHLGYSQMQRQYAVFAEVEGGTILRKSMRIDLSLLIALCGSYVLSLDLYTVFRDLGGFILGSGCISQKWLQFLVRANRDYGVSEGRIVQLLSAEPVAERNVTTAAKMYRERAAAGELACVWSGRQLSLATLAVDHLLPFSVWKSNDLWNLVPANSRVNARKSDKIPARDLLVARKESILTCWRLMYGLYPDRFSREVSVSLLGGAFGEDWEEKAFERLCGISAYLIEKRGYEGFTQIQIVYKRHI